MKSLLFFAISSDLRVQFFDFMLEKNQHIFGRDINIESKRINTDVYTKLIKFSVSQNFSLIELLPLQNVNRLPMPKLQAGQRQKGLAAARPRGLHGGSLYG